ncbi:MAG TPA: hypothetical protein DD473_10985 [Planctomycetaceae bacterium]|nr:hypothetical protein [Planctomycetaceae bacterium]
MRTNISTLFCSLIICIAGCGYGQATPNYDTIDLIDVSGKVTFDGQPLAGAVVSFIDEASSRMSYGITNADGKYQLRFDRQKNGVTPGSKIVKVSTSTVIEGVNDSDVVIDEETGEPKAKELIPPQYNVQSELRALVEEGKDEFNFTLMSSAQ